MASAEASPAWRRPRRPCTASRTAFCTSWVSVGSGVRLSNGSTATVLMPGGSPPPAKPYRQPVRKRALMPLSRLPGIRRKAGAPSAREKGQVEPGGHRRHREPGACRGAVGSELGFGAADDFARLPDFGDELAGGSAATHVFDGVGALGVLPHGSAALAEPAQ